MGATMTSALALELWFNHGRNLDDPMTTTQTKELEPVRLLAVILSEHTKQVVAPAFYNFAALWTHLLPEVAHHGRLARVSYKTLHILDELISGPIKGDQDDIRAMPGHKSKGEADLSLKLEFMCQRRQQLNQTPPAWIATIRYPATLDMAKTCLQQRFPKKV